MTTHLEIAAWAQRQYDELGMLPTLEPKGTGSKDFKQEYEEAHSPWPRGMGNAVIPLHPYDHAIHDVFQSEAVGSRHFFVPHVYEVLYNTPSYFPKNWFEACDLYEKWAAESTVAGRKHWYLPGTEERRMSEESPGEGWIEGRGELGTAWHIPGSATFVRAVECPGPEWLPGTGLPGNALGKTYWHNPETNQSCMSEECPGEGWIRGTGRPGNSAGRRSWRNIETGEVRMIPEQEELGEGWELGGHPSSLRNSQWWYLPGTDQESMSVEAPGLGWELGRPSQSGWESPRKWLQLERGEMLEAFESPGEGWVLYSDVAALSGGQWWCHTVTDLQVRTDGRPGSLWRRGRKGKLSKWINVDEGLLEVVSRSPGKGWVLHETLNPSKSAPWWHHSKTGVKVKTAVVPGPGWLAGKGSRNHSPNRASSALSAIV